MTTTVEEPLVYLSTPIGGDMFAHGTAIFSADGKRRYKLTRRWAPGGPTACYIGMNPSVADHETDDMTIKKEIGFSQRLGFSALVKINLFSYIATDPKGLLTVEDPVGDATFCMIRQGMLCANMVIAAWGAMRYTLWLKSAASRRMVGGFTGLKCFGKTKSGAPRHTSRLAYATPLEDWP